MSPAEVFKKSHLHTAILPGSYPLEKQPGERSEPENTD